MKQEVICHSPILATPGLEGEIDRVILIARLEVKDGKTIIHLGEMNDYYVAHLAPGDKTSMHVVSRYRPDMSKHPYWPFHSGCTTPRHLKEIERVQEACK